MQAPATAGTTPAAGAPSPLPEPPVPMPSPPPSTPPPSHLESGGSLIPLNASDKEQDILCVQGLGVVRFLLLFGACLRRDGPFRKLLRVCINQKADTRQQGDSTAVTGQATLPGHEDFPESCPASQVVDCLLTETGLLRYPRGVNMGSGGSNNELTNNKLTNWNGTKKNTGLSRNRQAKPKDLLSPHKMPVIRAPGPDRIGRTFLLPFHLL